MENARGEAFAAVRSGDREALAGLLRADAALAGARDDNGVSLLMQACYHRRPEMVEMLRAAAPPLDIFEAAALAEEESCGAALLAADPGRARAWSGDGFTPLHLAAFFGREPMARLLLAHGADPDAVARNPMAVRPLHSAAACPARGIVAMLLDAGADVNARQHGGWTALHAAAMSGDLPLAERLLGRGADPGLANDDGKTPLDLAVERQHAAVAEALRARASVPG
jgi:ankyrin repeat protein